MGEVRPPVSLLWTVVRKCQAHGEGAVARLAIMEKTTDGFPLAEEDLRILGPGDFAGVRQSGIPHLVFADLVRDAGVLRMAKEVAEELYRRDPDLSAHGHEGIRKYLERREACAAGPARQSNCIR
jgi:ATP-dependent DNA helicase RecG